MVEAQDPAGNDFWRFSLEFYGFCRVAPALIALQDRDGLDINLMLFALWLGVSGRRRLDSDALRVADRAIREIRAEIVEPLRALRRSLKGNPDNDVQSVREGVKALELDAEKLAQSRLARLAGPVDAGMSAPARLAAAYANLALYLGSKLEFCAEAAVLRKALNGLVQPD
jgi:uncharacterized protein (TIGR02444 family)